MKRFLVWSEIRPGLVEKGMPLTWDALTRKEGDCTGLKCWETVMDLSRLKSCSDVPWEFHRWTQLMLEDPLNLHSLKVKESVMETVRVWEHQMRNTDLIGLVTRRKPKEWEPEVSGNLGSDIANRLSPKSWDMGTDGSFRFDPSNSEESYSKWGVFAVEEGLLEQGRPVDRVPLEKGKIIVGELDPFTFCVNASELEAVVQGLRSVPLQDSVNLVVDSMYVVSGIKKCCDVREIGNGKLEIVKVKENWELPSHYSWQGYNIPISQG